VDNAAGLFADRTSWVFELLEVFVANCPTWARHDKLSHLFFMMQPDEQLTAFFGDVD